MTNTKRNTFKVLFLIRRSKLLKNGEVAICMRLTVNGGIIEIMIKRSVPPEQWNQAKERSRGTNATAKELNHYLDTIKARILQIQREMEAEGAVINARTVRDRYNGVGCEATTKTILEVYQEHNDKCEALIGIDYSKSTVEKFGTSIKCLKEYIQHQYSRDDLYLKEVDFTFVQNFEFYLKTVRNCKHNSALKHLKNLKKVIKIALANEWMKRDPFIGMQFKYTETNTEFLTQEELTTLMSKDFGVERLNLVRDVFSFCGFTELVYYAPRMANVPDADLRIFKRVRPKMKPTQFNPRTTPLDVVEKIKNIDRSLFTRLEKFHIDLFLFTCFRDLSLMSNFLKTNNLQIAN